MILNDVVICISIQESKIEIELKVNICMINHLHFPLDKGENKEQRM